MEDPAFAPEDCMSFDDIPDTVRHLGRIALDELADKVMDADKLKQLRDHSNNYYIKLFFGLKGKKTLGMVCVSFGFIDPSEMTGGDDE